MIEINKIYNDDCINMMSKMPCNFIDGVITSPPYNIFNTNAKDRGYDFYGDNKSDDEYINWILDIFNHFSRILKKDGVVCWNMSYGTENPYLMSLVVADIIRHTNMQLVETIVWKKKTAMPNTPSKNRLTRICEFVFIFVNKEDALSFNSNKKEISYSEKNNQISYENVFNFIEAKNNDETQDLNKATFSTDLVKKLIDIYFKEDSLILDTFMGTGTTAVACKQNKLNFIGSELSNAQCEWANERLKKTDGNVGLFTGQGNLF